MARASHAFASGCEDRRSEEHTSELQSRGHLVCRLLLEKKKNRRSSSSLSRFLNLPQSATSTPRIRIKCNRFQSNQKPPFISSGRAQLEVAIDSAQSLGA